MYSILPSNHRPATRSRHWQGHALTASLLALLLSGCNSSGNKLDDDHDHGEAIDSIGRLTISAAGSRQLRVLSLDDNSELARFTLANPVSALSTSPGLRYVLAVQRTADQVNFVDGGLYQEDHGDHLHDYAQAPTLLNYRLSSVRPTHYEHHDGLAALFSDGLADPYATASVALLSDASIAASRHEASLDLPRNMHGTAEPRGDYLLATYRSAEATDTTLPSQVELYQRNGDSYSFIERFNEPCPNLHGSYSSHNFSLFGCIDGVLVVEQDGDNFVANKIVNPDSLTAPARIGTLIGNSEQDRFIGIAGDRLFAIDPAAATISEIDWRDGGEVTRIAHGYSPHGEHLLLLDSSGQLHLLDAAGDYSLLAALDLAITPDSNNLPQIVFNQHAELAYISDPAAQKIHVIDLEAATASAIELDFTPSKLAWSGIAEHGVHDH